MTIRVLLIEDDAAFADSVLQFLELKQFVVDYCGNGEQAYGLLGNNVYDVIVSDVNMPKMNGLEFCQQLRNEGKTTPLIFTSANIDIDDKLAGFAKGADDYLTKPFHLKELVARIEALSKRRSASTNKLELADSALVVDFSNHSVTREQQQINLPPLSWKLLEKLARSYPEAVSKSDLEFALWGSEAPDSNSLKVHIHTLRKLIDKPFATSVVQTVSGFGLKLGQR